MAIKASDLIAKFQQALDEKWGYIYGESGEIWTEQKQSRATRQQTIEYGRKWIGKRVADCSGLFSWAFRQLGGYMYHGSNTMYKSYCTKKGKLSAGAGLKPGTAVFTGTETEHGHVGLYIGGGDVIEAAGTQQGVIKSKLSNKKWTYWGELKGVDCGETEAATPASPPLTAPTLRKGDKGEAVAALQKKLIGLGYDLGKWGVDGDFGAATEKAVKAFQKASGLVDDGIVGEKTRKALEAKTEAKKTYSVTVRGLTEEEAGKVMDVLRAEGRIVTMMQEGVT